MNILISLQAFHEKTMVDSLEKLSSDCEVDTIFLVSSLMHQLEDNMIMKYSAINKVKVIMLNDILVNRLNNDRFILSAEMLKNQDFMYSDLLSSYRWLPIGLREDNDVSSFAMLFYYDILNFWTRFLAEKKIDTVILLNIEHSSFDSILIRTAKKLKINNIITVKIVGDYVEEAKNFYAFYDNTTDKYIAINQYVQNNEKKELSLKSNFSNFSEDYRTTRLNKIKFLLNRLKSRYLEEKDISSFVKTIVNKVLFSFVTKYLLYKNYFYIKKLKSYYEKVSIQNLDIEKKYIYLCLHFDPEAATLPTDNTYFNQLVNIRIVASSLPKDWILYVKEHPHQFRADEYLDILQNQLHSIDNFRSKNFYTYISKLKNVSLVHFSNNHQEMMKNAQFIVSNTGTVFREANYLKKQCITFSKHTIYNNLKNVHHVDNYKKCLETISTYKDIQVVSEDVNEMFQKYAILVNIKDDKSSRTLDFIINNNLVKLNSN